MNSNFIASLSLMTIASLCTVVYSVTVLLPFSNEMSSKDTCRISGKC